MKLMTLEAIGRALERADVSYLVAGGVAVNAHGHQRLTRDLSLVLRLTPDNVRQPWRDDVYYETEFREALVAEVVPGVEMRFVRLQAPIDMKEASGRPLDLDDARHLKWIVEQRAEDEGDEADASD